MRVFFGNRNEFIQKNAKTVISAGFIGAYKVTIINMLTMIFILFSLLFLSFGVLRSLKGFFPERKSVVN
jgi:hypothetical protein